MGRALIIGGGISGLSIGQLLKDKFEVIVFEAESRPGGLIKCDIVNGNLFHRTGGHVFNTKRKDVSDWFWSRFNKETEFTQTSRNASVSFPNEKMIPYPIENHIHLLEEDVLKAVIKDLISIVKAESIEPENFEEFLQARFGKTLYELYFQPYNYKVWRKDLTKVPLSWLEGKLPMPSVEEIFFNNIAQVKEKSFVHSTFFYPVEGGSLFLANRLSEGINIHYNTKVESIIKCKNKWVVNDIEADFIVFCGNVKQLPTLIQNQIDLSDFEKYITELEYHGTSSVFCEIEPNNYSWIYMPSSDFEAHRIICTGNFSKSNNIANKLTGTIEFTDQISKDDIIDNLKRIPFNPLYITHHYEKFTYPIQNNSTREMITGLKAKLEGDGFYLLGRFAEWEYFNMDAAIGSAIDLSKRII